MKNTILMAGILLSCLISNSVFTQTITDSLLVDGLCEMCKTRIEKAALRVPGVMDAHWDVSSHILTFSTRRSSFKKDKLHQAIAEAGHDTEHLQAPDEAYAKLHNCCKYRDPKQVAAHRTSGTTFELFVDGICEMCKTRIETAVNQVAGVEVAEWDIATRMLTVFADQEDLEEDQLHRAVAEVGHDTKKLQAPDEAYDQLHDCCKYRDAEVVAKHRPPLFKTATISGRILVEEKGKTEPLPGVNVYWLNGQPATVTDADGRFTLQRSPNTDRLIASYVGYYSDTISLNNENNVELTLTPRHNTGNGRGHLPS